MAAPNKSRGRSSSQSKPGRALALILVALVALTGGMFLSGHTTPRLGIDLAGGTSITLKAQNEPGQKNAVNKTNMDTAVDIINRRVNGLGVSEAEVQTQGNDHIVVNIPRGTNEKQAREQVGTTAQLYFRPVLQVAAGTPATDPSGSPSPSASSSPSGKSSPSPKSSADAGGSTASPGAGSSASAGSGDASPQGRAVPQALKADSTPSANTKSDTKDDAKASPSPSAPTAPDDKTTALFGSLDCSDKAQRVKATTGVKPTASMVACGNEGGQWAKYLLGPAEVEGKNVAKADAVLDTQRNQWIVQMKFNGEGKKKFSSITGKLAQQQSPMNQFAIVLDGDVVSAPSVSERLGGSAEISGSFSQESAKDLANVLSYGALPLTFHEETVTTVTAALGGEQLHAGLIAGAVGLALVIIYLVAYYRGLALIAIASLVVSGILTYTIMTLLGPAIGFALNLPAVCGAIVAIGITADSFIVFFERVRDEVREGRSLRPAVERGWPRARRTILVSDFVSFLAAAVLFVVTVGKVQGFAFTLGLTTLLDVVTVFLFTKPLLTLLARRKFFSQGHPWSGFDPKRLGAKPPLRRSRTPRVHADHPKEA
ncbi:protein translocase subunit SecD [Streptomyces sp. NPDC004959]|uniref:protein translocase subunit SecD n=1 Tax=unclassified Streptomyces TaxID=2593676 RepID=UPI0004C8A2D7|nr:protein translocase subunit SecD [Streptomyces sp. NRRL F-5630]